MSVVRKVIGKEQVWRDTRLLMKSENEKERAEEKEQRDTFVFDTCVESEAVREPWVFMGSL